MLTARLMAKNSQMAVKKTSPSARLLMLRSHLGNKRTLASSTEPSEVEFHVKNTARIVTLNRPKKLNALSTAICDEITPRLVEFSKSDANNVIIIRSDSERAFCSGGDVIQCAKDNLAGNPLKSVEFFDKEYNLNYLLSVYGKPIVSLVNGIVMGGGVGLSVHGPFRVVCETTRFAMPETNIGFFSDVGTSFWLPKLDGNLGFYLSLTGDELTGLDTLIAGYGTHYVPSHRFNDLVERLSSLGLEDLSEGDRTKVFRDQNQYYALVNEAIEEFTEEIPQDHKFKFTRFELDTIETCFNPRKQKSVEDIVDALLADGSEFAIKTAKTLQSKSQISLKLCWQLLNKSADSTIHEALTNELRLAAKLMLDYKPNDFNEYILKNLINKKSTNPADKELKPQFADLKDVPSSLVDELISLDSFNPEKPETSVSPVSPEDTIETLEALKISKFKECGNLNENYDTYPYQMGLPTQSEIESYIKGNDDSNRKYSVTFKETLKYFQSKYNNKNGAYFKVKEVLKRKTKPSEFGDEYLEWVD